MVKKEKQLAQILLIIIIPLILIAISSGFAFAQILNQPPNHDNAFEDDLDFPQSKAENFIVNSTVNVTQIRIWGLYATAGTDPATDNFTVIFYTDDKNLPAGMLSTQHNVPVIRQPTGETVSGYTEYVYTLTLTTPVNLIPRTYWVEIYNDTTGDADDNFYWETGTVDPINGIVNSAWDTANAPGSDWFQPLPPTIDFAIVINPLQSAVSVPTINEWGMIVFMTLAGFGTVVYLRRQNKATR